MSNPLRSGPYNSQKWVIDAYEESLSVFMNTQIQNVKWGPKNKAPQSHASDSS
uniref:Uncharacterized protein n=1 Tax=uncultured gamma proteobacterium EB080_L93H08 TaxID=710973 RepID=E0Y2Y1_9GAMM|nr:hypothetical protein [uncultured gamma proteobacterium EB080_L93H08]